MLIISRIDTIFEAGLADGLYAIQYEGHSNNILTELLQQYKNYDYVLSWLKQYNKLPHPNKLSPFKLESTARHIVLEALTLEKTLQRAFNSPNGLNTNVLNEVLESFYPHDIRAQSISLSYWKLKTNLSQKLLRFYAIRLNTQFEQYLITGGAIKLTMRMELPHLQEQITLLHNAKSWLENQGFNL